MHAEMIVQDIIAVAVVALALAYAVRFMRRAMSGSGPGCRCGTGEASCRAGRGQRRESGDGLKRLPAVTLDEVGTPGTDGRRDP